jgi:hypothetical protein
MKTVLDHLDAAAYAWASETKEEALVALEHLDKARRGTANLGLTILLTRCDETIQNTPEIILDLALAKVQDLANEIDNLERHIFMVFPELERERAFITHEEN